MHNFKFTYNGTTTIIRANKRETAIMLFCKAEGCSIGWCLDHCTIRKMREVRA